MRTGKLIGILTIFILSVLFLSSFASATVTISEVELNDDILSPSGSTLIRDVERGDSFDVKVHIYSDVDEDNVEIEAEIKGDTHDDRIGDETTVFDMKANRTYVKKMRLELTKRMDQDLYTLYVDARGRRGSTSTSMKYDLEVDTPRHLLDIKDVVFSPEDEIKAGRALLTSVRVKNRGEKDEDGVKVKVSIPELGVSASDFIDTIEADGKDDDEVTSEELYMRIPNDAKSGNYDVKVEVEFDDGDEKISKTFPIVIKGAEEKEETTASEPKKYTIITVGPESQDVSAGSEVSYPLTITNNGDETKTYTVSVETTNALESKVTPSNTAVVEAGESQTMFVGIKAKENAAAGQSIFSVNINSNGKTLQQISLKANVVAKETGLSNIKRGLEIGLVVLVILLVILGLIIGFNKLRGSEEDSNEESGTYY